MVVMPDHLHAIFTLPVDDNDYATRWMLIKTGFSRQIPTGEHVNPSRTAKANGGLEPFAYLTQVSTALPSAQSLEETEASLPWSINSGSVGHSNI